MFSKIKDSFQEKRIIAGILKKKTITGPWTVHLDLTNHCNNNCISCWSFSPLVGFNTMDIETRKKQIPYKLTTKIIDDLADMGTREIYFTGGGEPFMHPNAIDIMEYVKKKGMLCDMSTNLTLIDKCKAERIVKAKIDHMNCSVWAGSPEAYVNTHPNKDENTFHKITETLLHIHDLKINNKSKKPLITLYNVISNKNYLDFENMIEFAHKVKADSMTFTPTDIVPGLTDSLMLKSNQRKWLLNKAKGVKKISSYLRKKYGYSSNILEYDSFIRRISTEESGSGFHDKNIIGKIPCYAGFSFLRILATGEVNSCLKSGRIPVGNIYKDSIKKIWLNKEQENFRRHTINYDVNDHFFRNIGNTTQEGNGCLYCCDNLGWNLHYNKKINSMKKIEKNLLKIIL